MSKEAYNKILVKLQRLNEYLVFLKEYQKISKKIFLDDYRIYGAAERYLQLAVQIILDAGQMLIVAKGFRRPEDNQDVFSVLRENKVIASSLDKRLAGIANFRNILVHDYEKIDHGKVYENLEKLKDFADFKKQILRFLSRK